MWGCWCGISYKFTEGGLCGKINFNVLFTTVNKKKITYLFIITMNCLNLVFDDLEANCFLHLHIFLLEIL